MPTHPLTYWVPNQGGDTCIPEGYVLVLGPDNQNYIIPEFMVPALEHDFRAIRRKRDLRASSAPGTVSYSSGNTPVCPPAWNI